MKILLAVLFCALILSPCPGMAEPQTDNHITWLVLDLPPFFITEGPDEGRGLADQIQKAVIRQMPGYRHETRVANASRIARELMGSGQVCFAGEFYGNTNFLTSVPTVALLPHALIVRREDVKRFRTGNRVSLSGLLKDKNLVMGTARDCLYGPELDVVLEQHKQSRNIYHRSGTDTLDGLLGMLMKGRVDYLIEYPVSIRYAAKNAGVLDRIMALAIKESAMRPPSEGPFGAPTRRGGVT